MGGRKKGCIPWNKGKTKSTDARIIAPWLGKKRPDISKENHYKWIEDRTKIVQYWTERNNPEYKQWRKEVYNRDNYKCKIDTKECDGRIVAHHILSFREYPELRYEIKNGITLCEFHHPRKRIEEKNLSPYLQSLLINKN